MATQVADLETGPPQTGLGRSNELPCLSRPTDLSGESPTTNVAGLDLSFWSDLLLATQTMNFLFTLGKHEDESVLYFSRVGNRTT